MAISMLKHFCYSLDMQLKGGGTLDPLAWTAVLLAIVWKAAKAGSRMARSQRSSS